MIPPLIPSEQPAHVVVWLHHYWSCVVRKPRRYRPQPNPVAPRVRQIEVVDQSVLVVSVENPLPSDMADLSGSLSAFQSRLPNAFGTLCVTGIRVQEFQPVPTV